MEPGPGFGVAALDEWIGDRLPGCGAPLQATRMGEGTGEANALSDGTLVPTTRKVAPSSRASGRVMVRVAPSTSSSRAV